MSILEKLLGGVASPVADYLKRRLELKEARRTLQLEIDREKVKAAAAYAAQGQVNESAWETLSIQNSGWKDEYWTLVLSLPMVLCFVRPLAPVVADGFAALELTPEWYRYSVGVAIASAFGVKPLWQAFRRGK